MPILPRKLEIHGYFAFRQPQEIQFEPLWKSGGLWGILGPNGAGKSSILEAILLALYHKSPRKSSEATITTRGFSGAPYIRFYFEHEGKNYVCAYPSDEIKKIEKKIRRLEKYDAEYCKLKSPEDVQELLGLSYEDFILTVVLPQGRFASLLESTLSEQSRILSGFLPDRPWEIILEKVKKIQSFLKSQEKELEGQIQAFTSQLNTLSSVSSEKLEALEKELEALEERRKVVETQLKDLNLQLKMAEERDRLQQEYQQLTKVHSDLRSQEKALQNISNPEISSHLREIDHLTRTIQSIDPKIIQKNKEIEDQYVKFNQIKQKVAKLEQDYNKLRPFYEKRAQLSDLLSLYKSYAEAKRNLLAEIERMLQKIKQLKTQRTTLPAYQAEDLIKILRNNSQQGNDFWDLLKKLEMEITTALEKAEKEREKLQVDLALEKYVAELREGEPCPICGSTHHPHKRRISDNIPEELKQVENKLKALQQDKQYLTPIQDWQDRISTALQNYIQKKEEFSKIDHMISQELGTEVVSNFLKSQNPGKIFEEGEQIKDILQNLYKEAASYEARLQSLTKEKESLQKEQEDCKTKQKVIEAELLQSLPEKELWYGPFWQKLRKEGPNKAEQWARERLEEIRKKLERYDLLDKTLHKDDSPYKNLPPTHELHKQVDTLSEEHQKLQQEIDRHNREKGELQSNLKQKEELLSKLEKAGKELERLKAELTLIEKVSGSASAGELEKFFVRQVLLRPLIEEVNGYLREWLGGALELQMPEEQGGKSSKKEELLQIRDVLSAQGEPRPPHTLSGGEKFLVSLAMALALSDRIMYLKSRNSKSQTSFFFIDEGFDTLSTENFAFVMRTLQRLAAQGRYIGLISHKIEAREYLSAYLKVEKENHTTRVKLYQNTYGSSDFI